jgi:hypothetical protein
MSTNSSNTWIDSRRIEGLRRFAVAITILNLLGHTLLGFEQSWAQPIVSIAAACSCELFCEWIDSSGEGRRPRFLGSVQQFIDFLLPAHITALAVAMLLYSSDRILPIALASTIAIASKYTLRLKIDGRARHFLNPSNFGITMTLLFFPWVGIAAPYQFSENLRGNGYWILPAIICVSGTFINYRFTQRIPLIAGWWSGFLIQAALRNVLFDTPLVAALNPMTGVAFVLFSFYMITDPATTPFNRKRQILFGLSVAALYGLLVCLHLVFGFFFALTIVCVFRGLALYVTTFNPVEVPKRVPSQVVASFARPGE